MFANHGFCLPKFSGIVGYMTAPQWEELGRKVRDRRLGRGWSQAEVAARGGPSDTLQTAIENGTWTPARSVQATLIKIDTGMQWVAGSASTVLAGGEPTPIEGTTTREAAAPDEQKEGDLWETVAEVWNLVDEAIEELANASPTAELIDKLRQLVTVFGAYVAEPIMGAHAPREARDKALAELYRRRDRSDLRLKGIRNAIRTDHPPTPPRTPVQEGTQDQEDQEGERSLDDGEPMPLDRLGPSAAEAAEMEIDGGDDDPEQGWRPGAHRM